MTACKRPGCGGTLTPTGYCGTCGRLPLAPAPVVSEPSVSFPTPPSATAGDGEMNLPPVSVGDPTGLVIDIPRPPTGGRRCGKDGCQDKVGIQYGDQPPVTTGRCPTSGHPYTLDPQLDPGEVVNGQYEVVGYIAHGGLGWVYLARDRNLDNSHVALKGLINNNDATALRVEAAERRFLTALRHDHIVGIRNFVTWKDIGYIVMEFVNGRPLSDLLTPGAQKRILGRRLRLEHVAVYGCRILAALEYLHQRDLVYCDMKPDNVIHHGDQITIIDLGAVRRIDDRTSPLVYTKTFLPRAELYPTVAEPAPGAGGSGERRPGPLLSPQTDLYTVATTLQTLAQAAVVSPGVAKDSFDLLIARATAPDRGARFASAAEMSEQLRGVWRQLRAEAGEQQAAQSTVFAPASALLDDGLGAPPPLRHWLRPPGDRLPPLAPGRPVPDRVAAALPAPVPHPKHPRAARELQVCDASLAVGRPAQAQAALERGCELLTPEVARHDWRVAWYCGRLLLARGNSEADAAEVHRVLGPALALDPDRPRDAGDCFASVHFALPGEPAPKLALAYCAEFDNRPEQADAWYRAVWQRDHADASAAFGLARLRLARGDRSAAREVLDQVPSHAPHHLATQIAAVRLLAAWLPDQPPTAEDFTEAAHRVPGLQLDDGAPDGEQRLRLTTEIRESALCWARVGEWPPPLLAGGPLFGAVPRARRLGELLEGDFTSLARRAGTAEEHATLTDHANHVRPMTLF